jgi:hypothetical protein
MCRIQPGGPLPAAVRAGLPASSETEKVRKRKSHVTLLPVEAKSRVKWSYSLNGGDIAFFVFYAPPGVDVESLPTTKLTHVPTGCVEIVPPTKLLTASGEYLAPEDGHVVLVGITPATRNGSFFIPTGIISFLGDGVVVIARCGTTRIHGSTVAY